MTEWCKRLLPGLENTILVYYKAPFHHLFDEKLLGIQSIAHKSIPFDKGIHLHPMPRLATPVVLLGIDTIARRSHGCIFHHSFHSKQPGTHVVICNSIPLNEGIHLHPILRPVTPVLPGINAIARCSQGCTFHHLFGQIRPGTRFAARKTISHDLSIMREFIATI